ncbi:flagellar motor protein MotB [Methylomonas lenta]|uniref:Flagellar motor protein MotB n=1 Tax=Methylomonas lenta TaxID=980561 RepID=A0A177MWA2_9GAMM|nr:OmpA family protein [Methylomonas lenta]OAI09986.1 flagellar motor protein MotB [Methylomonas lenta]
MQKMLTLTAALTGLVLSGCATQSSNSFQAFQADDLNAQVKSGLLVQKTNSFFVLNDSSSSMSKTYLNSADYSGTKLDVEKNLLNKFNHTIPDITLSSGLRSFGYGPCTDWSTSHLNQPLQSYSTSGFESAITSLECSSGGTPLAEAVEAAKGDIASAPGNIALVVFSDGMDETSPVPAAEALKAQYGDRLCIYTVWVGNEADTAGQENLQSIVDTAGCGMATDVNAISSAAGMSNFVKQVLFKPGNPVPDCSQLDEDHDGVNNCLDKCPDTPTGAMVDNHGCWSYHGVFFDFDSDKIKDKFHPLLKNAVEVMKLNPSLTVEIQGHTDSVGSVGYNLGLSERRANAVENSLIQNGVDDRRMTTIGFGKSHPAESNATEEGRAYNRRVEFIRTDR